MADLTPISEITPIERQRVIADQRYTRGVIAGVAEPWEHDWGQVPDGATLLFAALDTDGVDVIVMPDNSEYAAGKASDFTDERLAVKVYSPDGHTDGESSALEDPPLPPEGV